MSSTEVNGRGELEAALLGRLEAFSLAGVALVDGHGRLLRASAGFARLLGGDSRLEGTPLAVLLRHASGAPLPDAVATLVGEARPVLGSGGGPLDLRVETLGDPAGRYVALLRDRRESQRVQEYLVGSERLRRLGEMSLGLVHELNNLLAVVLGYSERLDGSNQREREAIQRAATDAVAIVRRVQNFSLTRPLAERFGPIEVGTLVEEALDFTRPRWWTEANATGKKIQLERSLERSVWIRGVASDLREVIANLLLNAVDAMPEGGRLVVGCAAREGCAVVRIEDTGRGIPPEARDRIFDPFFSTKGGRGFGLGLTIAASLVERHGGTISVESIPGCGTAFEVRLPLAEPEAGSRRADLQPTPIGTSRRILLVEDEAALGQLMADALQEAGHAVVVAASLEEAEHQLASPSDWDVIVTDLTLSRGSGVDVARMVRERGLHCPILLVTAWGVDVSDDALASQGISAILAKPFQMKDLCESVVRLKPAGA